MTLFRKSTEDDINSIMEIIHQAQIYLKQNNINQWQDGYPNYDIIYKDIINKNGYVICEDTQIVATITISFDDEPTYKNIYNGNWISNSKYAVIHRMAVKNQFKRNKIASKILENVENMCIMSSISSIRIDTHKQNTPMQKLLYKNEFVYCGIIYLADKSERLAFEKVFID